MAAPWLDILLVLLLMVANGVFAMAEIALVSARRARLQHLAEEGDSRARTALELASDPNAFLSTVQVGITLVGIFAGAFGGATLSRHLQLRLEQVPALRVYAGPLSLFLVVAAITYLSLVVGELAPKRIGMAHAERIALVIAGPMRWLSRIAAPLIALLSVSTDLTVRLLGVRRSEEPVVTEEEVRFLIKEGTRAGVFAEAEEDLVESVLRLADRRVRALGTPRTEIEWIDLDSPPEEIRERLVTTPYSRLPAGRGALDEFAGIVVKRDVLQQLLKGEPLDVEACLSQPLIVPETMNALRVLELFRESRNHFALTVDEHGGIQGVVTLRDLLEAIVGELPHVAGEGDSAVRREDGSWLLDGLLPAFEVRDLLGLRRLPGEEDGTFDTLGGFVMNQLGHIPGAGDRFELDGFSFEVVDMDGRRVDKVLVCTLGPDGGDAEGK